MPFFTGKVYPTRLHNIFSWDGNNSKNIKTEVSSLAFKVGASTVPVQNTSEPIKMKIRTKPEDMDS